MLYIPAFKLLINGFPVFGFSDVVFRAMKDSKCFSKSDHVMSERYLNSTICVIISAMVKDNQLLLWCWVRKMTKEAEKAETKQDYNSQRHRVVFIHICTLQSSSKTIPSLSGKIESSWWSDRTGHIGVESAVLLSLASVTGNKPRLDNFRVRNNFRYLCFASLLRNIDNRNHLSFNYYSTITLHCVSLVVDYLAFTAGHAVGILPWTDPDAEGMTLLVIFHHHCQAITAFYMIDKAPECCQTYLAGV